MSKKYVLIFLITIFCGLMAATLWAAGYTCEVHMAKSSCWKDYTVTVQPFDATTQQNIGSPLVLDKNTLETTATMACLPNKRMAFKATFSPPIWEGQQDTYPTVRFWQTPANLPEGAKTWIVHVCFSKDFTSVPLPTTVTTGSNCQCQFQAKA